MQMLQHYINMTTGFACVTCSPLSNNGFKGLTALVVTCNNHCKYCLTLIKSRRSIQLA